MPFKSGLTRADRVDLEFADKTPIYMEQESEDQENRNARVMKIWLSDV